LRFAVCRLFRLLSSSPRPLALAIHATDAALRSSWARDETGDVSFQTSSRDQAEVLPASPDDARSKPRATSRQQTTGDETADEQQTSYIGNRRSARTGLCFFAFFLFRFFAFASWLLPDCFPVGTTLDLDGRPALSLCQDGEETAERERCRWKDEPFSCPCPIVVLHLLRTSQPAAVRPSLYPSRAPQNHPKNPSLGMRREREQTGVTGRLGSADRGRACSGAIV
jgi:hypothetical protein